MAVDRSGDALSWDGRAWSKPVRQAPLGDDMSAVSCPSPRFCMALVGTTAEATRDGRHWSTPAKVSSSFLSGISCASSTFCAVVDSNGAVSNWHGGRWSAPREVDPHGPARVPVLALYSISCPSASFCAVEGSGHLLTWDGTHWSKFSATGVSGLSCTSANFCLAAAFDGAVFRWDGRGWSQVAVAPLKNVGLTILSCASRSSCALVAGNLTALWDGSTWSAPTNLGAAFYPAAVSCPAAGFCLAIDGAGDVEFGRFLRPNLRGIG
jgi:hypothetical protein